MFVRLISITSLAVLAIATPVAQRGSNSQCDTGNIQCCDSTQTVDEYSNENPFMGELLSVLVDIGGKVGVGCSPLSVIGTGQGATCTQEPVCCSNQQFNGLVNVGCSPINIIA